MDVFGVRQRCRRYAEKFIGIQRNEFKRLGVQGEWDDPYLTMSYDYEATIAAECFRFAQEGSLFRSKKPILWCCSCQTALAEAEIEYADEASPSIYVKFPFAEDLGDIDPALSGRRVAMVIWTTTPWTLPANEAVALHAGLEYVLIAGQSGGRQIALVVARELLGPVVERIGLAEACELGSAPGAALEHLELRHPFYDRLVPVILGDHVTVEAGTGAVHTAPGHGAEDFETGQRLGLPMAAIEQQFRRMIFNVVARNQDDHAKNIAKYVVFIVQGKDVRHVKTKVLDQEI